jgi:ABC-2 type transport system ATP-binding protein
MILKATNVSKTFSKTRKKEGFSLDINSFEVQEGNFTAILGPNGSGKSTLIKLMLDLLYLDNGSIQLLDHDHKDKEARRGLSYLPENFSFPEKFKVRQMLHTFADISQADKTNLDARINELAKAFNVDYLDKKIKDLSKGMRQTVALLHTFLGDYKFHILDEPFNGLDAVQKKTIMEYIFDLQKRKNVAILITTHILSDIEKTCDKLYLIRDGSIIDSASKDEIEQQHGGVESYYLNHFESKKALQ